MNRRTTVAIERYRIIMLAEPLQEYDVYAVTTAEERNHAEADRKRIMKTLKRVVRDAEDELAKDNEAWALVRDLMSDELLEAILDPSMLDEEALCEVEIYVRNHF